MSCQAEEISWYFKVINNTLRSRFDTVLKEEGLTKVQFEVLIYIFEQTEKGIRVIQRDVETHFQISNPSVSTMITRLETKDLLARESGEKDRRKRYLLLTPKAQGLVKKMHQQIQEVQTVMLTDMDPELLKAGVAFLKQILCNLTNKEVVKGDFDTCQSN